MTKCLLDMCKVMGFIPAMLKLISKKVNKWINTVKNMSREMLGKHIHKKLILTKLWVLRCIICENVM